MKQWIYSRFRLFFPMPLWLSAPYLERWIFLIETMTRSACHSKWGGGDYNNGQLSNWAGILRISSHYIASIYNDFLNHFFRINMSLPNIFFYMHVFGIQLNIYILQCTIKPNFRTLLKTIKIINYQDVILPTFRRFQTAKISFLVKGNSNKPLSSNDEWWEK